MKRLVVAFIAGAVTTTAGFAGAAATRTIRLASDDHIKYAGVDCQATNLGSARGRWLTCLAEDGWKYSALYGRYSVTVFRGQKIVFSRSR